MASRGGAVYGMMLEEGYHRSVRESSQKLGCLAECVGRYLQ